MTDLTATSVVPVIVLGVSEPHGTRLAHAIEDRLGMHCAVTADVQTLTSQELIITTPGWALRLADAGVVPQRLAILWGDRPVDATAQRYQQQGITLLTGAMPRCALDWLSASASPHLRWDDDGTPDASLVWQEEPAPRGTQPISSGGRSAAPVRGLSIAVFSSGGGVGKTTTAVYLATIASSKRYGIDTGLVELDENRSGMLTYWDRAPHNGGLDSVKPGDWSDPQRLAATLSHRVVSVGPRLSAIAIEGTPEGLQYHRDAATAELAHLYTWAQQRWGLTIYDLPATIRDHAVLQTMRAVDCILFVLEPTTIMYESSLRYLNTIQSMGITGQDIIAKTGLVVNKVPKQRQARLDPRMLADSLGLPLWGQISEQTQRYMAGINQHRITPTPEWDKLWGALPLSLSNRLETPPAASERGLRLFRRKERDA